MHPPQSKEDESRKESEFPQSLSGRVEAEERAIVFRQNVSAELKRLRWVRSATRHRISKERTRYALEHCRLIFKQEPPPAHPTATDLRLIFLGEDPAGIALEVVAVEADQGKLMVIHAMGMRSRYRGAYQEVRKCSK